MKSIEVKISGSTNSGKTAVAIAIEALLVEHGFKVKLIDEEMTKESVLRRRQSPYDILDKLNKDELEVSIISNQLHRSIL